VPETRTVDVVVTGRVQGVGFRVWTQHQAQLHGLTGHVRNRADGAVQATLCGPAEAVETMLKALRSGPRGSDVADVSVREAPPFAGGGFEIQH
jgi:acylphosphatase